MDAIAWNDSSECRELSNICGQFLTGLLLVVERPEAKAPEHLLYSGFLVEYKKLFLWVSAGHVIREIDQIQKSSNIKFLKRHFLDQGDFSQSLESVPVELDDLRRFWIYKDGIDIGALVLTEYYVNIFASTPNNAFITKECWESNGSLTEKNLYLVGFPKEKEQLTTSRQPGNKRMYSLRAETRVIPCSPVTERIDGTVSDFWDKDACIYARLVPTADGHIDDHVNDIKFMSGGAIFSLEHLDNGDSLFSLRGIQGSWLANNRIIRGTRIEVLQALLDGLIERTSE